MATGELVAEHDYVVDLSQQSEVLGQIILRDLGHEPTHTTEQQQKHQHRQFSAQKLSQS